MKKNELTRQGFMDLNLMEANDREGDPSDLWVTYCLWATIKH